MEQAQKSDTKKEERVQGQRHLRKEKWVQGSGKFHWSDSETVPLQQRNMYVAYNAFAQVVPMALPSAAFTCCVIN